MGASPDALEWKDPEPKPPDDKETVNELLDRVEGEILELRVLLIKLRTTIASL